MQRIHTVHYHRILYLNCFKVFYLHFLMFERKNLNIELLRQLEVHYIRCSFCYISLFCSPAQHILNTLIAQNVSLFWKRNEMKCKLFGFHCNNMGFQRILYVVLSRICSGRMKITWILEKKNIRSWLNLLLLITAKRYNVFWYQIKTPYNFANIV